VLAIGTASTSDPSLLPGPLLSGLSSAPSPQVVSLTAGRFYRYLDLTPSGAAAPETVYVAPSTAGTIVAICMLAAAGPAFPAQCERTVAGLRLASGRVLAIGPSASYGSALSVALAALNATEATQGARLARARLPRTQASAAALLAHGYDRAAVAVGRLAGGPAAGANAALASALRTTGRAYAALAHAARRGDRGAYDRARQAIARTAPAISTAFAQLAKFGYAA
jgi:hypothetical protein